jgi:hypothetical protein
MERGPISLVSTTEELLGRKSSGSSLENREYGHRRSAELSMRHPPSVKVGINFEDKRRSLEQYTLFGDSVHGVFSLGNKIEGVRHSRSTFLGKATAYPAEQFHCSWLHGATYILIFITFMSSLKIYLAFTTKWRWKYMIYQHENRF